MVTTRIDYFLQVQRYGLATAIHKEGPDLDGELPLMTKAGKEKGDNYQAHLTV
jgi:hypothetical protein